MSVAAEQPSAVASPERWLRRLPSPTAIFALALGGVMLAITVSKGVQDADFFWHVTTGRLIAESGSVPTTDPFSFTWQGQPWTLHEWLAELVIFWLTDALGRTGALVVFGLIPAVIVAILAAMLARRGVSLKAFALPAVLIGLVMAPYVTLRPQAVSWLFLAGLLWFLAELRPERPRTVLWLIPGFVLWANLHGVYVIGLGVVATYTLFTLLGRTPMSPHRGWVLGAAIGCVLAGMATPAGPIGLVYPLRYVEGGDWGLANIQEWQSPDFHNAAHWPFLGMIVAAGLNGGRKTPGWLVMLSWVGIVMGLVALRNVPIAAIFTLPTLALGLQARLGRADGQTRPMVPRVGLTRRLMELGAAVIVVVGAMVILVPMGIGSAGDQRVMAKYPVAAVGWLQTNQPDANVLAEYGWGGYVIHELYDSGGRVFVDGRNDMYDQRILEDYDAIKDADPGWDELAAAYGVEALLLPPGATVTRGPAADAGWCEVIADSVQVLLLHPCPTPAR